MGSKKAYKITVLLGIALLALMVIPVMAWCPCGDPWEPGFWDKVRKWQDAGRPGEQPPKVQPAPKPVQPAPQQPAPQQPAPEPEPAQPDPQPEPTPPETTPAPQPEPVQPAPVQPAPVEPVQPEPTPTPAPTPDPGATQPPVETPNSTPTPPKQDPGVNPPDNKIAVPKPPAPPPRPPAGTGLEPLVFNPVVSVPMWENWWARNRLHYLPFKQPIKWNEEDQTQKDGTISVEMNSISKQALDNLIKCLKEDVSPFLRANAALALGKFKHKNAVAALKSAMLDDKTPDVRNVAALSLGIMGEESVVNDLKAILLNETDRKSQMISQAYAALALGYIKTEASINALKESLNLNKKLHKEVQASAVLSLGNLQDKSLVEFIGKVLTNESYDEAVRSYAAIALGRIKDESVLPYLKKAMNSRDISVRSGVAIALGLLELPKAKTDLLNLLRDKSTEVQAFAAVALAQLGDNGVYNDLNALTKKSDFNIEGMSFIALGLLGNKSALPDIQKIVVKKTKPLSRGAAILALGLMKDSTSVNILIDIVKKEVTSDPVSWDYAVLALGMIGDKKAIPALEEAFKKVQDRVDLAKVGYNNLTVALAMLGKRQEVLDTLYKKIEDKLTPTDIKSRALNGIAYIGDKGSIDHLVKYYDSEKNDELRFYSILAIGFILDKDTINPLYKITADMNFKVKMLIQDHIFFSKPD
ncbi:MAG: HEAT repeat domain-containing protein [Planctomycetes bacterium]|nr:HEAT repeat domain-containing protein [Planctomycetota bacterium]